MVKIRGFDGLTFKPELYGTILYKNLQYLDECQLLKSFNAQDYITKGLLYQEKQQFLYLYEQQFLGISTLGLLAELNLNQYKQKKIKKHEKTLKRAHLNEKTYAKNHVGPVIVGHQFNLSIDNLLQDVKASSQPFASWSTIDDRKHKLWRVSFSENIRLCFQSISHLYILDGHHRFQAALTNLSNLGDNAKQKDKWIQGLVYSTKYIQCYPQFRQLVHQDYRTIVSNLMLNPKLSFRQLNQYHENTQSELVLLYDGKYYEIKYIGDQEILLTKSSVQLLDEILKDAMKQLDKIGQNPIKFIPSIMFDLNNLAPRSYPVFLVKCPSIRAIFETANLDETLPPKSTWLEPKPCLHMVIRLPY